MHFDVEFYWGFALWTQLNGFQSYHDGPRFNVSDRSNPSILCVPAVRMCAHGAEQTE